MVLRFTQRDGDGAASGAQVQSDPGGIAAHEFRSYKQGLAYVQPNSPTTQVGRINTFRAHPSGNYSQLVLDKDFTGTVQPGDSVLLSNSTEIDVAFFIKDEDYLGRTEDGLPIYDSTPIARALAVVGNREYNNITLKIPVGVWYNQGTLGNSNGLLFSSSFLTLKGAGMGQTVFIRGKFDGTAIIPRVVFGNGDKKIKNLTMEDMTILASPYTSNGLSLHGHKFAGKLVCRRVKFDMSEFSTRLVSIIGVHGALFDHCIFDGGNKSKGVAVNAPLGCPDLQFLHCTFRGCYDLVRLGSRPDSPSERPFFLHCLFENPWQHVTMPVESTNTTFTGWGFSVTEGVNHEYYNTNADNFPIIVERPLYESNLTALSETPRTVYLTSGINVPRGSVVRCASGEWAIVSSVLYEDDQSWAVVGEWFDRNFQPTHRPDAGTAFSLLEVIVGEVRDWTELGGSANHPIWLNTEGNWSIPDDGNRARWGAPYGNYNLYCGDETPYARMLGCTTRGGRSDTWFFQSTMPVSIASYFENGEDLFITSHGDDVVTIGCYFLNAGSGAFYGHGDNLKFLANRVEGHGATNRVSPISAAVKIFNGDGNDLRYNSFIYPEWRKRGGHIAVLLENRDTRPKHINFDGNSFDGFLRDGVYGGDWIIKGQKDDFLAYAYKSNEFEYVFENVSVAYGIQELLITEGNWLNAYLDGDATIELSSQSTKLVYNFKIFTTEYDDDGDETGSAMAVLELVNLGSELMTDITVKIKKI